MLTAAELEIQQRAEKATPGPWSFGDIQRGDERRHGGFYAFRELSAGVMFWIARVQAFSKNLLPPQTGYEETLANAEFIAHARQDIPALLQTVAELRQQVAQDAKWVMNQTVSLYEIGVFLKDGKLVNRRAEAAESEVATLTGQLAEKEQEVISTVLAQLTALRLKDASLDEAVRDFHRDYQFCKSAGIALPAPPETAQEGE